MDQLVWVCGSLHLNENLARKKSALVHRTLSPTLSRFAGEGAKEKDDLFEWVRKRTLPGYQMVSTG